MEPGPSRERSTTGMAHAATIATPVERPRHPPILIAMGVCGCGKSVIGQGVATRLGFAFLEGDELHPPANVERMSRGIPLTDTDRIGWLDAIGARIAEFDRAGASLVVSCSALKRSYRDRLRSYGAGVGFLYLRGGAELIRTRMASRSGHFMPVSLIESQFAALEEPGTDEPVLTCQIELSPDEIIDRVATEIANSVANHRLNP